MKKNNNKNRSNQNMPLTIVLGLIPVLAFWLLYLDGGGYFISVILSITILYWLFKYSNGSLKNFMVVINIIVLIASVAMFLSDTQYSHVGPKCANAICEKCETKGKKTICSDCFNPADDKKIKGECIYSNGDTVDDSNNNADSNTNKTEEKSTKNNALDPKKCGNAICHTCKESGDVVICTDCYDSVDNSDIEGTCEFDNN